MIKFAARSVMAAAAATMALAPVAAQANTRAGDSASVYRVSASKPGVGRAAQGESNSDREVNAETIIIALLATAAIIGAIIIAASSGDNNQSPGT
ncbi:hypothetical protein ABIE62_000952 [Porphyrobacter sp. MBR-155]|jgi:hypothetical protein|uniref:hypothetical protein n=1 Tax=Porphyrobacter sp. MBR-155 TaxID=3156464 RepID=UPI00339AC711